MHYKKGIAPLIIALIAAGTLLAGGGTYTGVTFYQSRQLVKEGDRLMKEGNYAEALTAYEKAGKKFKPSKKRIEGQVQLAQDLQTEKANLEAGEESIGKGEWQKCLEYLGQVTSKFPNYGEVEQRYSDCQKKLKEETDAAAVAAAAAAKAEADAKAAAEAAAAAAAAKPTKTATHSQSHSNASSSSSNSNSSSGTSSASQERPTIYLPFSLSVMPDGLMPMGETINHPKPQNPTGHPGLDFQWNNPSSIPNILASMEATVTGIRSSDSHAGAYDVATRNGLYEIDYTEMGSVQDGLKVGDTVHVGDVVGTPQHPANVTDQPNYRMIHWQFGYGSENESIAFSNRRLCPLTFFAASARSTLETLWANTNWPEMKANAPDICSGDYAGLNS